MQRLPRDDLVQKRCGGSRQRSQNVGVFLCDVVSGSDGALPIFRLTPFVSRQKKICKHCVGVLEAGVLLEKHKNKEPEYLKQTKARRLVRAVARDKKKPKQDKKTAKPYYKDIPAYAYADIVRAMHYRPKEHLSAALPKSLQARVKEFQYMDLKHVYNEKEVRKREEVEKEAQKREEKKIAEQKGKETRAAAAAAAKARKQVEKAAMNALKARAGEKMVVHASKKGKKSKRTKGVVDENHLFGMPPTV